MTEGATFQRLNAVRILWDHRKHLPDPLQVEVLPAHIFERIKLSLKPSGQTKSIPLDLLSKILTGAFDWVIRIGPALIELNQRVRALLDESGRDTQKIDQLLASFTARYATPDWPGVLVRKTKAGKPSVLLNSAVHQLLPVSCVIVIVAMTARRKSEVQSLKSDCLEGVEGQRYLKMYIAKLVAYDDATVCPEIVAKAVELMQAYRSLKPGVIASLWPEARGKGKKTRRILEAYFDDFATVSGASAYKDGDLIIKWHYAFHQFRRAFAIIYVWRFEGALLAIQHHFRHTDWTTIFSYIRDKEIDNEVTGQHAALTVSKLRDIAGGSVEKPGGAFSKTLNKHIERIRRTVDVCDERGLDDHVDFLVNERELILKPNIWGFCGSRRGASSLRRAACQSNDNPTRAIDPFFSSPDPQGSSEEICAGCPFFFSDGSREPHWRTLHARVIGMIGSSQSGDVLREPLERRAKILKDFIGRFFDEQ